MDQDLTERIGGIVQPGSRSRVDVLARILESFTETLDLEEVLRRVVRITMEELSADRAWLLAPVSPDAEFVKVIYEATVPEFEGVFVRGEMIPLATSRKLIERVRESSRPLAVAKRDADLEVALAERFHVQSQLIQLLRTRDGEEWAFGLHQCSAEREWTEEEIDLFQTIGRYATLAINNASLLRQAQREAAKLSAVLDQIPEAAAIHDREGRVERLNAVAIREAPYLAIPAARRLEEYQYRSIDGRRITLKELPLNRGLRGETVRADYLLLDPKTGEDRIVHFKSAPIYSEEGEISGSVVITQDVTQERRKLESDTRRRRRAEFLATFALDLVADHPAASSLEESAERIGKFIEADVSIFIYRPGTDHLELAGASFGDEASARYGKHVREHPFRSGEGLPGTVFQIGRPLLFSEVRGNAQADFARSDLERELLEQRNEKSLMACPIEAYSERVGVLVASASDRSENFDAEDLEFLQAVGERIGAALHVKKLSRMSLDGQKAAEELARQEVVARARLEAVLESAPIGIAVISADELRFEMANPIFCTYAENFGRISPYTKLVGLRVAEVVPDFEGPLQAVAEEGVLRVDQAVPLQLGENLFHFNSIISPVRGRLSGATQSLTVLVQDVTEQVRAKREIEALAELMEERSARLDSIYGSMTDALWVYDENGHVVDVNQATLTMFELGSRSEAMTAGSLADFDLRYPDGRIIPPNDLPQARALRGEVVPDYLAVGATKISRRDMDLSIALAPIQSNGIVGGVLVIRDITALQELDRKKDEFLSVASHELRTPLTTIKGYTQLLASIVNDIDAGERATYLGAVLGEIERMMGLIAELLDVSRIETKRLQLQRQPVDWLNFLERQASAFRVLYPDRRIRFDPAIPEVIVDVDPDRIRQVVDNLVSNALKYSPEESEVTIQVSREKDAVVTTVSDRGIGIPEDEIAHLFERFHRARNVSSRYYGGLGLGLYIARAIIEAHDGSIDVKSEEGVGSKFILSIPLPSPG